HPSRAPPGGQPRREYRIGCGCRCGRGGAGGLRGGADERRGRAGGPEGAAGRGRVLVPGRGRVLVPGCLGAVALRGALPRGVGPGALGGVGPGAFGCLGAVALGGCRAGRGVAGGGCVGRGCCETPGGGVLPGGGVWELFRGHEGAPRPPRDRARAHPPPDKGV
ncbi:hypothetical protein T484DRAFT_1917209, partial [Baffinella frigidus]